MAKTTLLVDALSGIGKAAAHKFALEGFSEGIAARAKMNDQEYVDSRKAKFTKFL